MSFWNRFFLAVEGEIKKGEEIEISLAEFYDLLYQFLEEKERYLIENKDVLVKLLPFFKVDLPILQSYARNVLQISDSQIETLKEKKVIDIKLKDWDKNWKNDFAYFIRSRLHPTEAEIFWELFKRCKEDVIDEKNLLIEYASVHYENLYHIITPIYFTEPELFKEICKDNVFVLKIKRYLKERHLGKHLDRVIRSLSVLQPELKEMLVDNEILNVLAQKLNDSKYWLVSKEYLLRAMYKFSPTKTWELFKKIQIENLVSDFNNLTEDERGLQTFRKLIEVFKNIHSSYLFEIDSKFKTDLESAIVSEKLRECFVKNNYPLISDQPGVEKIESSVFSYPKRWKIMDEKRTYLVRIRKRREKEKMFIHAFGVEDIDREAYVIDKAKKILDGCYERFIRIFEKFDNYFTVFHWLLKNLNSMVSSPKTRISLGNYLLEKIPPQKLLEWIKSKDTEINELRYVFVIGKHVPFATDGKTYYDFFKESFGYNDIRRLFDNKRANLYGITITSMFNPEILAIPLYQYSHEKSFAKKISCELCDKPTNLYLINESMEFIEKNSGLSIEQRQFLICKIIIIVENYGLWKFLEPLSVLQREREKNRFLTFKRKYFEV
jgi:hypothetical protein